MSSDTNLGQGFSGLGETLNQLLAMQRAFSDEVLKLAGSGSEAVIGMLRDALGSMISLRGSDCCTMPKLGFPQMTASCCDVPEPCWMPRCLAEFSCRVCPGTTGIIRLRVTNDDIRPRTMVAVASGVAAKQVTFNPPNLLLGPKERGTITAIFAVSGEAKDGEQFEPLVWLRGCRDYYLRWTVTVGKRFGCCEHEVSVCDGPDNTLHWYDHFYCPRPCYGGGRQG